MLAAVADTHTLIWYLYGDMRLSSTARNFIEQVNLEGQYIGVSSITLVEMVYLIEKGRIAAESFTKTATLLNDPLSVFVEIPY